jgi:hypothetical protein
VLRLFQHDAARRARIARSPRRSLTALADAPGEYVLQE